MLTSSSPALDDLDLDEPDIEHQPLDLATLDRRRARPEPGRLDLDEPHEPWRALRLRSISTHEMLDRGGRSGSMGVR